jgi:hypothetical protein
MTDNQVSQSEALTLLRKARAVYVFVRHMTEDGQYLRITKAEAIRGIADCPFQDGTDRKEYLVRLEDGNAYIN